MNYLNDFWDIFDEIKEYPKQELAENGIRDNTWYNYVPSSFLDGLINHVDILVSIMIKNDDDIRSKVDFSIDKYHTSLHSKISILPNDVIFLAETNKSYWIFYYDKDVSDCSLGRIEKEKFKNDIDFKGFVLQYYIYKIFKNYYGLPLPSGWISY